MPEGLGWTGMAMGLFLFWIAIDLHDEGFETTSRSRQIVGLLLVVVAIAVLGQSVYTLLPGR